MCNLPFCTKRHYTHPEVSYKLLAVTLIQVVKQEREIKRHLSTNLEVGLLNGVQSAGGVTALSKTLEGHIRVASSNQERKTGPFNTPADVTIKSVPDRSE
jgi:hypothetical protein